MTLPCHFLIHLLTWSLLFLVTLWTRWECPSFLSKWENVKSGHDQPWHLTTRCYIMAKFLTYNFSLALTQVGFKHKILGFLKLPPLMKALFTGWYDLAYVVWLTQNFTSRIHGSVVTSVQLDLRKEKKNILLHDWNFKH